MFEFFTSLFTPVLLFLGFSSPVPEPIVVEPAPVVIPVQQPAQPVATTTTPNSEPAVNVEPEPVVVHAAPERTETPVTIPTPIAEQPATIIPVVDTPSPVPTKPLARPSSTIPEVVVAVAPVCGDVHKETVPSIPTENLCAGGTPESEALDNSIYSWQCISGDAETDCQAFVTTHGACGVSSDVLLPQTYDKDVLCSAGQLTAKRSNYGVLTWSCEGLHDGYDATCSAKLASAGSCGSAQGKTLSSFPTTNLCKLGEVTNQTEDDNYYTWSCEGVNGGNAARCTAFVEVPEVSSPASEQIIPCYKDVFLTPC